MKNLCPFKPQPARVRPLRRCLFTIATGLCSLVIAVGGWTAFFGFGEITRKADAYIPKPLIYQPAHRLRRAIHQIDNQLANLLENVPPRSNGTFSPVQVRITYLIAVRHLYKVARQTRNAPLRAALTLRADELAAAAPAFGKLVGQVFTANAPGAPPPTPANVAAYAALRRFQTLGGKINQRIGSMGALARYTRQALVPLLPLVPLDLAGKASPDVWPQMPPSAHTTVQTTVPAPVSQTILNIQQANLRPSIRRAMRQIVTQLETGSPPHLIPGDEGYYHLMLGTLALAQNLQSSTVLGVQTQTKLNHQLLIGLLLFKDPRTRSAATRRLQRLGFIANALTTLEGSFLPPRTKLVIGTRMHSAIRGLSHQRTRPVSIAHLQALQQMIGSYTTFTMAAQNQPSPPQQAAWKNCLQAAAKIIKKTTIMLMDGYSSSAVTAATRHLNAITDNLGRLLAMPQTQAQALLNHPVPVTGVQRNIVRWTREIGAQPDQITSAARNFDQMQSALNILAHIRVAMPHHAPDAILRRLSAGKYDQFVTVFLDTQHKLVNSLAQRHLSPGAYIAKLRREYIVFRCTSDLAVLEAPDKPLHRLNAWGAWYISKEAESILNQQLQEALASQYLYATGGNAVGDNWLTFAQAAPAIHALAVACRLLDPALPNHTHSYSTLFLKAATFPPHNALLRRAMDHFQMAATILDDAAFNETLDHTEAAKGIFRHAVKVLGQAGISP